MAARGSPSIVWLQAQVMVAPPQSRGKKLVWRLTTGARKKAGLEPSLDKSLFRDVLE